MGGLMESFSARIGQRTDREAWVDDAARVATLVAAAQRGDKLAVAELIDLLMPAVGRWCAPVALQDAQDATQEALIAIFRGIRGLRDPATLYGWARTIALREAIRVARAANRTPPMEPRDLPAAGDPEVVVEVRDLLARLTPEHRAVLVLRDLEGLDERAAGLVLNVPPGTVKSRLSRARSSFRKGWQQ
jgi:RNA polymerase sigma factor (sigma-70 family)